MYSHAVSLVLTCMIVTGAARSVAVKLFYQLGSESPLFITLLYLLGQALSLAVYGASKMIENMYQARRIVYPCDDTQEEASRDDTDAAPSEIEDGRAEVRENTSREETCKTNPRRRTSSKQSISEHSASSRSLQQCERSWTRVSNSLSQSRPRMSSLSDALGVLSDDDIALENRSCGEHNAPVRRPRVTSIFRLGSQTGLTDEAHEAAEWVRKIPWYLKPVLPGFFNLCNSALRWASLVFVAASIAEMLISGMELILSVFAARLIRHRHVSIMRWAGVGIVTLGIVMVGTVDVLSSKDQASSVRKQVTGIALIVGQCILSVLQDMAEELFMQEAAFPATLLLGMEGMFGIIFGLILYFALAPVFGEVPSETWNDATNSKLKIGYGVGLVVLFMATGIFNIMATGVTSSMTRNMWKNVRTALVWVFGLTIYYASGDEELGEPWLVPNSFFILIGFTVMTLGIHIYYKK